MTFIVIELQRDALDRNVRVSDLLRKALVVARKLNLLQFQEWIENELNGYKGGTDIPAYREVSGQIRGWNPYRGWIPLMFENSKTAEMLSRRPSGQSVAQLEHLIEADGKESSLQMPYPHSVQRELSKGFGFETEVSLFISSSNIVGIVDAVRTIILNWALKLESEGILGENLSFSDREKETASRSSQNITNFYGPVQSPQVQQGSPQAVQVSTSIPFDIVALNELLGKLRELLKEVQLDPNEKAEVNSEIRTLEAQVESPKPKSSIIREGLSSIRRILEGAGGGAVAHLITEIGKLLGA